MKKRLGKIKKIEKILKIPQIVETTWAESRVE